MAVDAGKLWSGWLSEINAERARTPKNGTPAEVEVRDGTYLILNAKSGVLDSDNFAAIIGALNRKNERYEEVEPANVPGVEPMDDSRPLRAVYLPNEGSLDPNALVDSLERIIDAKAEAAANGEDFRLFKEIQNFLLE